MFGFLYILKKYFVRKVTIVRKHERFPAGNTDTEDVKLVIVDLPVPAPDEDEVLGGGLV